MKLRSVSNIAGFFRHHRLKVLLVVVLQVLAGFAENIGILALLPVLQGLMASSASPSSVSVYLTKIVEAIGLSADMKGYLILITMAVIAKVAILYASGRAGHALVMDIMTETRLAMLRGLIGLRWPEFSRQKTGEVTALQITEMERFRPSLNLFLSLMTTSIQIVIYLVSSILVSWQLTIVALCLGLLKVVILKPIRRSVYKLGVAYSEGIDKLTIQLIEGLHNIKSIRAMGSEESLFLKLKKGVQDYRTAVDGGMKQSLRFTVVDDFLTSALLILVIIICSTLLSVDVVQLAIVAMIMSRVLAQVGSFQKAQHVIDSTAFITARIQSSIRNYDRNKEFVFGARKISLEKEIRFSNVALGYDGKTVLENVNLIVPFGCLCALVGRSGGGKTTLIDCVMGLMTPMSGKVLIDGVDLADADIASWRTKIGYVAQDVVLFNDTIMSNIVMGRAGISEADVRAALAAAEALDFVDVLSEGLQTIVGERGTALSGGQRQRLALARALIHKPDLLILDEATSALDPVTEAEICQTLRRLAGKQTILAVSHQQRIADIADMIVDVDRIGHDAEQKHKEYLSIGTLTVE